MVAHSSILPADWSVPKRLRARLGATAGRQRLLEGEGHLVLVLHAPPTPDEAGRRGRFFWRDPEGNWRSAPKAEHITSLEEHLEEFERTIEKLEQAEDDARLARDFLELLDRVAPLVRSTRNLHDVLQSAREAVGDDRRLITARDKAYELARRAELLYEDSKNGLDFAVALRAEQNAEHSRQMAVAAHRLNLLVAFFFPIATLMAIFGANLGNGLARYDAHLAPLPLLGIIAFALVCGAILTWFVTRPAARAEPSRERQREARRT